MTYAEQLKDPRWQKRRLEILQRDEWRCLCGLRVVTRIMKALGVHF